MSEEILGRFDLLGDPIPEGFGKRGRPEHIPTVENRNKVRLLLALGWAALPDPRDAQDHRQNAEQVLFPHTPAASAAGRWPGGGGSKSLRPAALRSGVGDTLSRPRKWGNFFRHCFFGPT